MTREDAKIGDGIGEVRLLGDQSSSHVSTLDRVTLCAFLRKHFRAKEAITKRK